MAEIVTIAFKKQRNTFQLVLVTLMIVRAYIGY